MGKIISFSNQKGGTGKTSLAVNIGVLWSNSGYKVAIFDADSQKSFSNWFDARKNYYGEDDIGIDLLPYNSHSFENDLKDIRKNYNFIIIDSPPIISYETIQIVKNSDRIIVPTLPSPVDLLATVPFLNMIKKERKNSLVVLNRVLPRAKLTEAMILRLRYAGAKIARSRISSKVIYAETFSKGRGVVDISVRSSTSKEIIKLGDEIIRNF